MPKILIIAWLAAVLAPMSAAQLRGRPGVAAGGGGFRHFRSGGFGSPYFYADYGAEPMELTPPPVVVEKRAFEPERPVEPVLIEWNGDRFVRYGEAQKAEAQSPDYVEAASVNPAIKRGASSENTRELPPAVLIYRDGHREEVRDYVITRGVLYARSDYWQPGSGMRSIQLSALDLSATLKANEDSGVKFVLPAGPNEVVTRP